MPQIASTAPLAICGAHSAFVNHNCVLGNRCVTKGTADKDPARHGLMHFNEQQRVNKCNICMRDGPSSAG
jgi:hypothetical protein